MTDVQAPAAPEDLTYSYRPSLLGAAWSFRLTQTGIAWETGRKSGLVPYRDIRRVRLSFKPVSMQSQRFLCEVWADGAPKLANHFQFMEKPGRAGAAGQTLFRLCRRNASAHRASPARSRSLRAGQLSAGLLAGACVIRRRRAWACLVDRARLAGRRHRRRGFHRRLHAVVSLAGRQFFSPQPPGRLSRRRAAGSVAAETKSATGR